MIMPLLPRPLRTAIKFAAEREVLQVRRCVSTTFSTGTGFFHAESSMGVKKTGKGRRKLGQKKRRMRARIRHRK